MSEVLKYHPNVTLSEAVNKIANGIRDFVYRGARVNKAVVNISGGVDSALTLYLTARAINPENVYALVLPSKVTPRVDIEDAYKAIEHTGVPKENVREFNIEKIVDKVVNELGIKSKVARGNTYARIRMASAYALANDIGAVVVGTGNKTELMLGYFTKYGDGGVDFLPIGDLYKTEVWQLAEYVGIPENIIKKPPSARLWIGQTDEGEIGMSYQEMDEILYAIEEYRLGRADRIIDVELEKPEKVRKIRNLMNNNRHKLEMPEVLKL